MICVVKNTVAVFAIAVLLNSCSKTKSDVLDNHSSSERSFTEFFTGKRIDYVSSDEMKNYVIDPDNGLIKSKKINEYIYSVKYKPIPFIIANENKGNELTSVLYQEREKELNNLQYFDLRLEVDKTTGEILKYNLGSVNEYEWRVDYLAFQMQNDIKLIDGTDTLDCLLYHFERAYDAVPYSTVLLGFKNLNKQNIDDKTIVLRDKLFKNGIIKLTFIKSDLEFIPRLKV